MFVLHFIGDIHQPLHTVGFLEGGTELKPVCWARDPPCTGKTSLHAIWDANIPHRLRGLPATVSDPSAQKLGAAQWAADLYSRQTAKGVRVSDECADVGGFRCILGWAREANKVACSHVFKRSVDWIKKHDLSETYYDDNWAIVDELVGKAGVRLGAWLNAIAATLAASGGPVQQIDEL
jgi:hypothetical protein